MALTYLPEDTTELQKVRSMDYRCSCGQRRTVDAYTEPSVVGCIAENCTRFFVLPPRARQNTIEEYQSKDAALNQYNEIK